MVKSGITRQQNIGSPFIYTMWARPAVPGVWAHSQGMPIRRAYNELETHPGGKCWLISQFYNQRLGRVDVSGILHRRSRPFANYSLRNPECVSLGLGALQPTQMFTEMKCWDYIVAALWPLECAFKEDSQAESISLWHHITDYRAQ